MIDETAAAARDADGGDRQRRAVDIGDAGQERRRGDGVGGVFRAGR